jgi:hypothetical protein
MSGQELDWLERRWVRRGLGLALLAAVLAFLITGPGLPGPAGTIIQRNIDQDIQATALFYMDLDRMPEIQEDLEVLLEQRDHDN